MLVNAKDMLDKALAGHYAIPQFNINNLEWTKSILLACEECKSPVILGVSEGAGKYMTGFKTVVAMVKAMDESLGITVPVALHLDHGTYEGSKACIEAGFTSIMFDGSHYDIKENVEKTKEFDVIPCGGAVYDLKRKDGTRVGVMCLDKKRRTMLLNTNDYILALKFERDPKKPKEKK